MTALHQSKVIQKQLTPLPVATLTLEKGQVVYRAGQFATYLYEVISGMLILWMHLPNGHRQIVEIAPRGGVCGFSDHGKYDVSCEAVCSTSVHAYRLSDLDTTTLTPDHKRLSLAVEGQICSMHQHALSLGQMTAVERVAAFLLRLAPNVDGKDWVGCEGRNGERVFLPMDRQEIADYLGVGLETLSRSITDLESHGIIARGMHRHEILIVDSARLCRLAHAGGAR